MNHKGRVFGQNLDYFMEKRGITVKKLADELGYTENEVYRIIDARQYVDLEEKKNISKVLDVSLEELETEDSAIENPGLECRGKFSKREYKNLILDLFDAYCDIQELLSHYRNESEL